MNSQRSEFSVTFHTVVVVAVVVTAAVVVAAHPLF